MLYAAFEDFSSLASLVRPIPRFRSSERSRYNAKFGSDPIKIPVDQADMMTAHIENFLSCIRSREKPHLDVETGARAQAVINLAVQSYRESRVLFWDDKTWKASPKPQKA